MGKHYLYVVIATILSGTVGVLVKLIGQDVHFMTLNFYRIFFGFLFLLIVVPFIDKKVFKISAKDAREYFMVGLLIAVALSLYTSANLFAPVQNVVLLNHMAPFFVLLFGAFMLQEKITSTKIITLFIAIFGLIVINPFQSGEYTVGNILAFSSALFYGMLMVGMRKESKVHRIGDVFWFFFFASILLSPFPFVFGFGDLSSSLGYLIILGMFSTGFAYMLYNFALHKIEAEMTSIMKTIITPFVSIVLALVILGEMVNLRVIIGGGLLILSGVYLETHVKNLKKRKGKRKKT